MKTELFEIVDNLRFNPTLSLLTLRSGGEMPVVHGGQFVNVLVGGDAGVMLRRPISVCNVDYNKNELWLLVKDLGRGSHELCRKRPGDKLDILYPLGNGFSEPPAKSAQILLAGGGVGIAPLLYWGKVLRQKGYNPTFLLGGRSADDLPLLDEFMNWGELLATTDDGSLGSEGIITFHARFTEHWDMIYCCGPMPMMKAVASSALKRGIACEVSLENKMACGLGACLCCVEDTDEGNLCTCTSGPVFNIKRLKWQI